MARAFCEAPPGLITLVFIARAVVPLGGTALTVGSVDGAATSWEVSAGNCVVPSSITWVGVDKHKG